MADAGARGRIVAVVGPTAVGKSEVALGLAEALDGEIVSLDSRQVYRGMDIGTAKPGAAELARVAHHLVDIASPDRALALPDVQRLAYEAIDDVLARGRLPIATGGTGQYVRAVLEGWEVPAVPPDEGLRAELEAFAAAHGAEALHARLAAVDAVSAARTDPRNVRRVIRALEVSTHAGEAMSAVRARSGPRYDAFVVGLRRPRPDLYARIDARIDAMLAAGLEQEVRALVAAGYGFGLPAMSGVGYGEWRDFLAGEIGYEEVVRRIRHDTRRLVRQQATWFREDDPTIVWADLSVDDAAAVVARVRDWLAGAPAR